MHVKQS